MPVEDIQTSNDYELFCEGRLTDPHPFFHRLRREDPVHWSERLETWVLTRYNDVRSGHRDRRMASDRISVNMSGLPKTEQAKYSQLGEHVSNWLGFTDPPKHTRMRNLISDRFTQGLARIHRGRAFG